MSVDVELHRPGHVIFDEEAHRAYLVNETGGVREMIRATSALAEVGIIEANNPWLTTEGRDRGTYVHEVSARLFSGNGVPKDYLHAGYVEGLLAFKEQSSFVAWLVEQTVVDPIEGYAGRFDLFGRFPDLSSAYVDLIDAKTGGVPPYVSLQTAGYARLLKKAADGKFIRRWVLHLPGNGSYRLKPLNAEHGHSLNVGSFDRRADALHESVFLAAVRVARWKRGLKG